MTTIKLNEINANLEVSAQEAADVKGGPVYMKLDGVKGDVTAESSSAAFVGGWGSSQYQYGYGDY